MIIQESYRQEQRGCLYLVPTPIGNLQDMTFRAVDTLKRATIIAAEDTRHTKKLCHYFSIDTPLISYHEHNKQEREENLVQRARNGEMIALVSDAGMPAISDPGADLVARFAKEEIPVIALPGANAALTALVVSALNTEQFLFAGFLKRKKKERLATLEKLKNNGATLLFYEAPHRIKDTLSAMLEVLGNRNLALCREITKQYETVLRGTIAEVIEFVEKEGIKGECVLVVEGAGENVIEMNENWWSHLSVMDHVNTYVREKGMDTKEAIKQVAKERQLKKREVYQVYHVE